MLHPVRAALATAALGSLLFACSDSGKPGGQGGSGGQAAGGTGGGTGGSGGGFGGSGGGSGGSGGGSGGSGGASGSGGGSGGGGSGGGGGAGGSGGAGGGGGQAGRDGGGQEAAASDARGDSGGGGAEAGGAAKMAVADIMPFMTGTITGKVTFVEVAGGVQVTYMLENCPAGRHPTHIHAGNGCGNVAMQGMHWGPARGEDIGPNGGEITCGADMRGMLVYTRPSTAANTRWTIGDGSMSDIIGHPVVIHGVMDSDQRHGCGVIRAAP